MHDLQASISLQPSINVELIFKSLSHPCSPFECNCLIIIVKVAFDAMPNLKRLNLVIT